MLSDRLTARLPVCRCPRHRGPGSAVRQPYRRYGQHSVITDRVSTVIDAEIVAERSDLTLALPDSGALPDVAVDINEVLTEEDLANSRRQNTRTTYDSRFKAFASWCVARGRTPGPRTTEVNLISYVSHLRREQIGHDTIRLSIAAIVDMNAWAGTRSGRLPRRP
ncbi:hypothetical protein [[Kitasatospora] papulosa]|uniref:hypothetical protein n=1 Tax=[Kitasatospora] papulosa TaxID=1464011 RepID=UPI0036C88991